MESKPTAMGVLDGKLEYNIERYHSFEPEWFGMPTYRPGQEAMIIEHQQTLHVQIHSRNYFDTDAFNRRIGWNYAATVTPVVMTLNGWTATEKPQRWERIPQKMLLPHNWSE